MIYHEDDIRKLTLDELAGIISEDDRKFLHQAIAEDNHAREVREQTLALFSDPAVQAVMAGEASAERAYEAIGTAGKRRLKTRIIRFSSAAAAVLLLATGIYLFKRPDKTTSLAVIKKDKVEIQLPDGTSVNLSDSTGNIRLAGMSASNLNKTLSLQTDKQAASGWALLNVPAGKDYKVLLPDGSLVWLNAASSLKFPLTFSGNREVYVNGEAYFEVAADVAHPFMVHLPNTTVRVLGTAFNVNTYDSLQEKISLLQGKVKVNGPSDSLVLKPGFEVVNTGGQMEAATFEENDVLAWRQGIHLFNNALMPGIVSTVKRMYNVDVNIKDLRAGKPFTGSLDRNQPLTSFWEVLKYSGCISGFRTAEDGTVYLN